MTKTLPFHKIKIAHRGIHDNQNIPENSLLAFQKALALGIPIELDVQLTKDNQLVVFHDERLDRMTASSSLVQDLTYDEVRKLTLLNTEEKIPLFREVLELIQGRVFLDIEIKNTDRIEEVCRSVVHELEGYSSNFAIKSFHPRIVRWFYKNSPKIVRGLLITDNYHNKLYDFLSLSNIFLFYCRPDFLAVSKKLICKKRIQKLRQKFPVLVWTIEDLNELDLYREMADGFICDCFFNS